MALLFLLLFILYNKRYFIKYNSEAPIQNNELKKIRTIKQIAVMLIAIILGCLWGNINYNNKVKCIREVENQEISLSGVVISKESNQYLLKNVYIDNNKIKGKVKIKSKFDYKILEELSSKVILELPNESMNFGGFNYRNYLYSKDIIATGEEFYKQEKQGNRLNLIESSSVQIREYIARNIDNFYPNEAAQMLKAILIGESSTLEDNIKEFYQKAGIIHVLVVSGAHIVLLISVLKALLDKFCVSKRWANYILIFLIIMYIYITGVGESVLRAGIVSIIALIAGILGRENDNITTIFLSVFILCLLNPMIIYSVGLQLSFSGALGIILLNEKIKKYLSFIPQILAEAFSVSFSAQLFILPITAYHFNSINLMGIIATLAVTPIIDLIMPSGFLGILPVLGKIISNANYFLLTLLLNDAKIFSYLNIFELIIPTPNLFHVVVYYLLLFICFFWSYDKRKLITLISIICIGCFVGIRLKPQELEINFLYVGHGDSIFIITPSKKTILIDTGDKYLYKDSEYNMAEKTVIPFVLDKGYKDIDLMILSHLDSDHAGGTETILQNLNVKQVIIGRNSVNSERFDEIKETCDGQGIEISLVSAGSRFSIDDIKFDILAPFNELNESENNNSVVLMMQYNDKKVLFMGDMELEGEELIVKKYNIDADIIKVGHHGSATSSTEELINEVTPKYSVISVGDRFSSLPSKEVLDRLKNSQVYITKEQGGISVIINKKGEINVETVL